MNVYLTDYCNLSCSYCFAKDYMAGAARRQMSPAAFERVLSFLADSKYWTLRLEGGEPTLHPQFVAFVEEALERGFSLRLFSNGLFGDEVLELIQRHPQRIACTWNVQHPDDYSAAQRVRVRRNLERLMDGRGPSPHTLGVNLHRSDRSLDYVFELCQRYRPRRLRYVVAHQTGGPASLQLLPPERFPEIAPALISLTWRLAAELDLGTAFDCGFVPCVWSDEQLATLHRLGASLGLCDPCPGVSPELLVGHCFHTSTPEDLRPLGELSDVAAAFRFCAEVKERYAALPLFQECQRCLCLRRGSCDRGCLGDRLARSRGV